MSVVALNLVDLWGGGYHIYIAIALHSNLFLWEARAPPLQLLLGATRGPGLRARRAAGGAPLTACWGSRVSQRAQLMAELRSMFKNDVDIDM